MRYVLISGVENYTNMTLVYQHMSPYQGVLISESPLITEVPKYPCMCAALVAQLVDHMSRMQNVTGLSPT